MDSAQSDQANHAAVRWLIGMTPRPCSLVPYVTTPLYSTTASQALRQTLRGPFSEAGRARPSKTHPLMSKRCMLALLEMVADFLRGCAHWVALPLNFATHSPPLRLSESPVRLTFVADDGTLRIAQEQEKVGGEEGGYRQGERRHRYLGRDTHAVLVC